ncbi:hypothetical protein GCM10010129_76050 [Streptomyces fumigatiscleroticus]|nr:hypothetical protein GCM10010129_76050 [Streptomyces fumigatiscleroticus]
MIKQVAHEVPGADPAGFALALRVAAELHAPVTRAPELAPRTAARRATAARARRRTAVRG